MHCGVATYVMRPHRARAGCGAGGPGYPAGQGHLPGGPARGAAGARASPRHAGRRRPGAQRGGRIRRRSARPRPGRRRAGPFAAVCAGSLVRRRRAGAAGSVGAGQRVRAPVLLPGLSCVRLSWRGCRLSAAAACLAARWRAAHSAGKARCRAAHQRACNTWPLFLPSAYSVQHSLRVHNNSH